MPVLLGYIFDLVVTMHLSCPHTLSECLSQVMVLLAHTLGGSRGVTTQETSSKFQNASFSLTQPWKHLENKAVDGHSLCLAITKRKNIC